MLETGLFVQRLFSTFADGWPGAGLLIQRFLVGAALLYSVAATPASAVAAPQVIGALGGLLLIAGLWTPFAGVVAACAEAWVAFSSPAHAGIPAVLAVLGVTLALIGPGEWSVDARLYGRKHIVPPRFNALAARRSPFTRRDTLL
jgi:putative oxidoreductase